MKSIIVAIVGTAIVGGIFFANSLDFTQVYQAETIEKYIDNTPDEFKDCPECIEAAKQTLRKKELEAELDQLESEITERQLRVDEIEKELGTY